MLYSNFLFLVIMSSYKDYWQEFRQIQESTKKKLLKKPNYQEAINQFRELSHDME